MIIAAGVVMGAVASLCSCSSGSDPAPTEAERVTRLLTQDGGKWNLPATGGVVVEDVDVTQDLFSGFSITFAEGTFTTTGNSPVWERQDTWHFKDDSATVIIRGQDDKEIAITSISDDQLVLTLDWDQETYDDSGRMKSIIGTYKFTLNK